MKALPQLTLVHFAANEAYHQYLEADLAACGFEVVLQKWNDTSLAAVENAPPMLLLLDASAIYTEPKILSLLSMQEGGSDFSRHFFIIADYSEDTPLKVESVSQIIHAMNFWQDKYLQVQVKGIKEGKPAPDLTDLEKINTAIGDLIRDIRAAEHSGFLNLVEQRYQPLFDWLEIDASDDMNRSVPLPLGDWFESDEMEPISEIEDDPSTETEETLDLYPQETDEPDLLTLDDIMNAGEEESEEESEEEQAEHGKENFEFDFSPLDLPGSSVLSAEDWEAFRKTEKEEENIKEANKSLEDEDVPVESTLNDSDLNLYRRLARLYAGQKDMKRALKMVRKAIKKGDRSIETEVLHAKILFKAGKKRKALDNWLQTCRKDPMQFNVATASAFGLSDSAITLIEKGIEKKTVLRNEVIFITGATAGIGEAIAKIFAKEGYRVIITGRRKNKLESLKSELERLYNARILAFELDVSDANAVEAVKQDLPDDWAPVHILVNNAGLAKGLAPIHQGNPEDWNTMIDTNIKGLLNVTRALSPGMVARGHGHIINIGSVSGRDVYADGNVYCATKFAVDGLTRAMRLDLHKLNIRVSSVSPGHVESEFALVRFDGDHEKADIYRDFQPLSPADVAEVVYFVANRPARVNIQDVLVLSSQQASGTVIDRSGRKF